MTFCTEDDSLKRIWRIATGYNVRGQVKRITSYDDPTVGLGLVENEVQLVYNAFRRLIEDYQAHSGAVHMESTPKVGYTYGDGSSGHARRTQTVYPNGRVLRYEYNPGADDALGRISYLADEAGSSAGVPLAKYTYLGASRFVRVDYTEPKLRYDLAHGDGVDPYAGLDRFNRVVDLVWRRYADDSGSSSSSSSSEPGWPDMARIRHGYDRAGNRLWRECPVAAAYGKDLDESYTHDGLNQLIAFESGRLNPTKTGLAQRNFAQDWQLDPTGNWCRFREDTDGDGSWELDQTRTHNAVNEITDIHETFGPAWITPEHDRNGNTTRIPKPTDPTVAFTLAYDAWNRLVHVTEAAQPVARYAYDGRNYRTLKETCNAGLVSETRHLYCSHEWQTLEERLDLSSTADRQFVWGHRYIDNLILRDRNADGNDQTGNHGKPGSALEERLYCTQDANWNVLTLAGTDGELAERCRCYTYGRLTFLTPGFDARIGSAYAWEFLFTGRRLDSETVMIEYRRRHLVTDLGRWNQRDPLEYADSSSLYSYCGNRPDDRVDPLGLAFWGTTCGPWGAWGPWGTWTFVPQSTSGTCNYHAPRKRTRTCTSYFCWFPHTYTDVELESKDVICTLPSTWAMCPGAYPAGMALGAAINQNGMECPPGFIPIPGVPSGTVPPLGPAK